MTRGDDRQRGFALLIVLWTLALLALLGTQLLATSRQHVQLAHNLLDAAALEAAANGAVQQAIFGVLDSSLATGVPTEAPCGSARRRHRRGAGRG